MQIDERTPEEIQRIEDERRAAGVLNIVELGRKAIDFFLNRSVTVIGESEIDDVLEGGLEIGNYYLFLGSSKSGKSTVVRSLAINAAKRGTPVLLANFEQIPPNVFAKLYNLTYDEKFHEEIKTNTATIAGQVEIISERMLSTPMLKVKDFPLYIAEFTQSLDVTCFNSTVRPLLKDNVDKIKNSHPGQIPIVVIENLSDIYNEQLRGSESLVNIVTQTAQDIKRFSVLEGVPIILAHHTGKVTGVEPTLDDVRDSKRVVDLAHSIFITYVETYTDALGSTQFRRVLKYVAGRGMSDPKKWIVGLRGPHIVLHEYTEPPAQKGWGGRKKQQGI